MSIKSQKKDKEDKNRKQFFAAKLRMPYNSGKPVKLQDVKRLSMAHDANKFRLSIPIEKCVSSYGWRYLPGEHPFVNFYSLEESLDEFYDHFRPNNALEGLTLDSDKKEHPVPKGSWIQKIIPDPPTCEGGLNEKIYGSSICGPVHPKKLQLEKSRLKKIRESIRFHGYNPLMSNHDLYGYFLVKNNDFVFHVSGGLHRSAALVDLGWPILPAVFLMGPYNTPRIVTEWHLDFLAGTAYPEQDLPILKEMFHAYFDENLRKKRRQALATWMNSAQAKVAQVASTSMVEF
ncbi:MAG: hypothetical protein HLUCCO16_19245 [Phormidium sp. OSCR]|nr:MAG: hypothetical protein HLUCCO16_19245 [Phormidium sp. OSCR]